MTPAVGPSRPRPCARRGCKSPRDSVTSVRAGPDGVTRMTWRAYGGEERCFSAYRVLAGAAGTLDTLTIVSDQSADSS